MIAYANGYQELVPAADSSVVGVVFEFGKIPMGNILDLGAIGGIPLKTKDGEEYMRIIIASRRKLWFRYL